MSMPPGRAGHFEGLDALIKREKEAAKGLGDLARAARQIAEAAAQLRAAPVAAAAAEAGSSTPAMPAAKDSPIAAMGQDTGLLASRIGNAIRQAEAPLNAYGQHIDRIFDRVAGTIIEGFRRVDANTKFPTFDGAITSIRTKVGGVGAAISRWALGLPQVEGGAKDLLHSLDRLNASIGALAAGLKPAPAIVAELAAETDQAVKKASALARAWEALKAQAPKPVNLGPPAGRRPGRGRAIPLPKAPAVSDHQFVFDGVAKTAGAAAVAFEQLARSADSALGKITLRGTMAGAILRGMAQGVLKTGPAMAGGFVEMTSGMIRFGQSVWRAKFFLGSLGDVAGKTFTKLFQGSKLAASSVANVATGGMLRATAQHGLGVSKAMGDARAKADGFASSLRRVGVEALAAFGVFGAVYKVAEFFKSGVKGASDLAEAVSASQVTFGKFADGVSAQADQMARAYGVNKRAQLDLASGFGEIALKAGRTQQEAAAFANTFTALAADFNSRKNFAGGIEEAGQKLISALSGEAQVLNQYGAGFDDANVKAYAYAHGLAKVGEELTNQAKFAARAALIQNGLASSQGDLARTADSAANTFRKSGGGIENFGVAIGQVLMPAVQAGAAAFNELLAVVIDVFEANRPMIEGWVETVKGGFEAVGRFARNTGSYFEIMRLSAYQSLVNIGEYLDTLPGNFAVVTSYLGRNWRALLVDMVSIAKTSFLNLVTNWQALGTAIGNFLADPMGGFQFEWTPLLKGLETTAEKFPGLIQPHLTSMQAEMDKVFREIQAREDQLKKGKKDAPAAAERKPLDELAGKDKGKKKKDRTGDEFAELAEAGSKEAYSAIVRHQFGTRDDSMRTVARHAPLQTELLRKIARDIKPAIGAGLPMNAELLSIG